MMFDLEAIERRHAAGSPAAEDMGDLIAEVKRLTAVNGKKTDVTGKIVAGGMITRNEARKLETLPPVDDNGQAAEKT